MANARGNDFDPHFIVARYAQLQRAHVKQCTFAFGHGSQDFHGIFSLHHQWFNVGYRGNQPLKPD